MLVLVCVFSTCVFTSFLPPLIFIFSCVVLWGSMVIDGYLTSLEFRANKPSDIVSTLISIYDSKDLFVKEVQALLAQRLLSIPKDNTDRIESQVRASDHLIFKVVPEIPIYLQRRNIEILKIRFGEAALQVCEVMLRDMTDSKRIDTHVQSQIQVGVLSLPLSQALKCFFRRLLYIPLSFPDTSGQNWRRATWSCLANSESQSTVSFIE